MKHEGEWLLGALGAAGAYLLAIMPERKHRAERMKGIFYAHRGLHDLEGRCAGKQYGGVCGSGRKRVRD